MIEKKNFIYMKLYLDIKNKIDSGELKAGERLPTEQDYQKQYQVSRDTLRKALAKLEQDGYITRKAATGTYVKFKKADYGLSRMKSFSELMHNRGLTPSSEILSIEMLEDVDNDVTARLSLSPGEKAYKICRIRKANGEPMAYEIAYIPQKVCPDLHTHLLENTSLYDVYEHVYGLHLNHGEIQLEAELPSPYVQKVLKVKSNSPLLKMTCTVMLESGTPLYYVLSYYIGEKYVFSANLPR
ncbi:GntR family transcriptional regulator [Caproiciproducens sp.]|uniref:GntR family transcriptional regulator n=1 Tax=Caproiciproducens sp. TaxID=1954376 RepID=UPI00289F75AA|nr:GntR family transcriptional regulator [Caproiciproducens sp.]